MTSQFGIRLALGELLTENQRMIHAYCEVLTDTYTCYRKESVASLFIGLYTGTGTILEGIQYL